MSNVNTSTDFKPYIPANKITPEFTIARIIPGIILAIVFGAANAYLGLRVGMTVSASIPAGAIFTMPALFLWAKEGLIEQPSLLTISLITVCGGILGVLFMIPLRNSIIVQEHGILPYPEAQACAEVLLAGEKDNSGSKAIFAGMGVSALFKFIIDGIKLVPGAIIAPLKSLKTEFSSEIYPAVTAVGYICGFKISSYLFSGGLLAWFVLIPAIILFGENSILFPADCSVSELYALGGASSIW